MMPPEDETALYRRLVKLTPKGRPHYASERAFSRRRPGPDLPCLALEINDWTLHVPPARMRRHATDRLYAAVLHLQRRLRLRDPLDDLGPAQRAALSILNHLLGCGRSNAALAAADGITPQTMITHVRRLEQAGLVRREHDTYDRRVRRVVITREGRIYVNAWRDRRITRLRDAILGLTERDQRLIRAALPALERLAIAMPLPRLVPQPRRRRRDDPP